MSKASQWAASYVAPPILMSQRVLAAGIAAVPVGFLGFVVGIVAEVEFRAQDWPPYVGLGGVGLIGVGLITIFASLACGAAKGRRCELACYGDGGKELACVNAKGELVSHLDGRSLTPPEAVKLGWWIVDAFTPSSVGLPHPVGHAPSPQGVAVQPFWSSGDADALRGTPGVDVNPLRPTVGESA